MPSLAPVTSPKPDSPARSASYFSASALRAIVRWPHPERLGTVAQAPVGAVVIRAVDGHADPRADRVEVAVELRPGQSLQPMVALPFLAHPVIGAQAVAPVDRRAAAKVGAGHERDLALGGLRDAARAVEVLVGPELELVEVRLVVVAAGLQDDDLLAGGRELAGDHAAARARADDDGVGGQRQRVADRAHERDRLGRLSGLGGAARGPG